MFWFMSGFCLNSRASVENNNRGMAMVHLLTFGGYQLFLSNIKQDIEIH